MGRQLRPKAKGSSVQGASKKLAKHVKENARQPSLRLKRQSQIPSTKDIRMPKTSKSRVRLKPVAHTKPLNAPHTDALQRSFELHNFAVNQNSKIESKVSQVLACLNSSSDVTQSKVVIITARAPAANKCISIVEIVKREHSKDNRRKLHQYTGHWTRTEEVPDAKTDEKDKSLGQEDDDEESDDAFEAVRSKAKIRAIPCLAVYLSVKPVSFLKSVYEYVILHKT
jgi:Alba